MHYPETERKAILFSDLTKSPKNKNKLVQLLIGNFQQDQPDDLGIGLLAHYPMNGTGKDFSGNENHAQNRGALVGENRTGKEGEALRFQNQSYLTVVDDSKLNVTDSLTISAWIAPLDKRFPEVKEVYENVDCW